MRWIWPLAASAAVALLALSFWSHALAPTPAAEGRDVTIAQAEAIDGDLVTTGRNVKVQTRIDGDLAVAGDAVTLSAPVDGYVLAAGSEVVVDAAVRNDLWAAGRQVTLAAPVADSVRLAGASVVIEPQASVGGDALLAGRSVEVRAPIEGDLKLSAAQALLASEVGGTVHARSGSLKLLPGAVVHGDLVAWGPKPPDIAPGAQVQGKVDYHAPSGDTGWSPLGWLWLWLYGFLALLALGTVVLAPSPQWSTRVAERIRDRFGASLLSGAIALLVVPWLTLLLAATIVGLPLAVVVFAASVVVLLLSGVFVALRLGGWLMARFGRPAASRYARLAVGALLLSFIAALPWIGWIAWLLVPLLGVGALLLERKDAWRGPRGPAAA